MRQLSENMFIEMARHLLLLTHDSLTNKGTFMKTLLALIFTLSVFSAFAEETNSNCAQIADSPDRTTREVAADSGDVTSEDASAAELD